MESSNVAKCHKILHSKKTEYSMGALIIFNLILVVIETDKKAQGEGVPLWMEVVNNAVLIVYCIELSVRLYVERCKFWQEVWNVIDLTVIVVDVLAIGARFLSGRGPSPYAVSLRVLRLARLARFLLVLEKIPELRLLMEGLGGALKSIFFGFALVLVILIVWSVMAVHLIHPLNQNLAEKGVYDGCDRCPRAFESVFTSFLTFFQQIVTGDSWGVLSLPIIENYPATMCFFFAVYASVGLSIMNLILAVICNSATETRQRIIDEERRREELQRRDAQYNILKICRRMDKDNSGYLQKDEVFEGYRNNVEFHSQMTAMNIELEDLDIVWAILDTDRSGEVDYQEFVQQLYKMRESDQQTMIAFVKFYVMDIREQLREHLDLITATNERVKKVELTDAEILRTDAEILRQNATSLRMCTRIGHIDGLSNMQDRCSENAVEQKTASPTKKAELLGGKTYTSEDSQKHVENDWVLPQHELSKLSRAVQDLEHLHSKWVKAIGESMARSFPGLEKQFTPEVIDLGKSESRPLASTMALAELGLCQQKYGYRSTPGVTVAAVASVPVPAAVPEPTSQFDP